MKKRLFITTALMTAVLGCSLATGTYAWYTASGGSAAQYATASSNLTAKNTYEKFGDLVFKFTFNVPVETLDLTDNKGDTYVITSGTNTQQVTTTKGKSSKCTVTIGYNNDVFDTNPKLAPYAATYTVTLAPSSYVRIVTDAANTSDGTAVYKATAGQALQFTFTINEDGSFTYNDANNDGTFEFFYSLAPSNLTGDESGRGTDSITASIEGLSPQA